jgi:hypothetical protein
MQLSGGENLRLVTRKTRKLGKVIPKGLVNIWQSQPSTDEIGALQANERTSGLLTGAGAISRIPLQYIGKCPPVAENRATMAMIACSAEWTTPAAIKVTRQASRNLEARSHLYAENSANRKSVPPQSAGFESIHEKQCGHMPLPPKFSELYRAVCMLTNQTSSYCQVWSVGCRKLILGTFSYSPHVVWEHFWVWFSQRGVDVAGKGSEVEQFWCGTRATRAATPKP